MTWLFLFLISWAPHGPNPNRTLNDNIHYADYSNRPLNKRYIQILIFNQRYDVTRFSWIIKTCMDIICPDTICPDIIYPALWYTFVTGSFKCRFLVLRHKHEPLYQGATSSMCYTCVSLQTRRHVGRAQVAEVPVQPDRTSNDAESSQVTFAKRVQRKFRTQKRARWVGQQYLNGDIFAANWWVEKKTKTIKKNFPHHNGVKMRM